LAAFQPSEFASRPGEYGIGGAAATLIGVGLQAATAITSTAVQTVGARKAQESSQKHQSKMAKAQEKLIALQTETAEAEAQIAAAQASLLKGQAGRTFAIVGGVVLVVGMMMGTVILLRRGRST